MANHLEPGVSKITRVIIAGMILGVTGFARSDSKESDRAKIRTMASNTLAQLYKKQPSAKDTVDRSAGYAVFSNTGMKIMVTGGGRGKGIAINSKTKQETFMKMLEVQAGLGFGVKKFQLVWVFETEEAFNKFVESGWEFGGQTTAAAKTNSGGGSVAGAVSVSPGVWLYQMTEKGLALELTVKGTKYYKDDDLNKASK